MPVLSLTVLRSEIWHGMAWLLLRVSQTGKYGASTSAAQDPHPGLCRLLGSLDPSGCSLYLPWVGSSVHLFPRANRKASTVASSISDFPSLEKASAWAMVRRGLHCKREESYVVYTPGHVSLEYCLLQKGIEIHRQWSVSILNLF